MATAKKTTPAAKKTTPAAKVDYNKISKEVTEDSPAMVEVVPAEEVPVEEVPVEEAPVEEEPAKEEPINEYEKGAFVVVDIDDVAKVNFREKPSTQSKVLMTLQNKRKLKVLKDEDDEWLFVELGDDSTVRGYIKKMFVKKA